MAKKNRGHAGGHGWFVTFADLMGLLVSFFVMLVAFSTQDQVKLRIVATGITFVAFLIPAGFGEMFNAIMGTYWGGLLNFSALFRHILMHSFREDSVMGAFTRNEIPIPVAWTMLVLVCVFALFVLNIRLRAREVVRG